MQSLRLSLSYPQGQVRPDPVLGAGHALRPRCAGALPSSTSWAAPFMEGLEPVSLTIQGWLQDGYRHCSCGSHVGQAGTLQRGSSVQFQIAPHQKVACALMVSLMLTSGLLCSGDGFFVFLYIDAHGSFIHNNPKLETTEMSICR